MTAGWTFKDGREYVVSVSLNEYAAVGPNFAIKISDKITAEEWSYSCDAKCIENLTLKTGSFKPFSVFVTMITSALLKKSNSVLLDLLTVEELDKLRAQKLSSSGSGSGSSGFGGGAMDLNNSSPIHFSNLTADHNNVGGSHQELGSGSSSSGRGGGTFSSKKRYLVDTDLPSKYCRITRTTLYGDCKHL